MLSRALRKGRIEAPACAALARLSPPLPSPHALSRLAPALQVCNGSTAQRSRGQAGRPPRNRKWSYSAAKKPRVAANPPQQQDCNRREKAREASAAEARELGWRLAAQPARGAHGTARLPAPQITGPSARSPTTTT